MDGHPIRLHPAMSEQAAARRTLSQYLPPNALTVVAAAFAIGVLLFAVVWFNGRQKSFYRADGQPAAEADVALAPLPAPLAAGHAASDMPAARPPEGEGERPHLVEPPAPAAPPAVDEQAAQAAAQTAVPASEASPDTPPQRIAELSPPPQYPPSALRGGEQGTVVLDVQVDANGRPTDVSIASRSGSRALDRAALLAVKGWRFRPALINGQPVAGEVQIPIEFNH